MKRIFVVLSLMLFCVPCVQAETLSIFIPSNAQGNYSGVGVAFGESNPIVQGVCEQESCEYEVPNGTTVSLWKAVEHPRYEFDYWIVNGQRNYSQVLTFQILGNTTVMLKECEVVSGLPVIIVPGIFGSWSTKMFNDSVKNVESIENKLHILQHVVHAIKNTNIPTEWTLDPISGKYDALRLALQDKYGSQNVFDFAYNWMQPIEDTAIKLQDKIAEVLSITGANGVNIVAHSMGGLVVRYYIQNLMTNRDIGKFAMIATPHRGSVDAYYMWEQGNFTSTLINKGIPASFMETLLTNMQEGFEYTSSDDADDYNFMHTHIPSVGQLMPTFNHVVVDFLDSNGSKRIKVPVSQMCLQNAFLQELNNNIDQLLYSGVEMMVFASKEHKTIKAVRVVDDELNECQDFAPDGTIVRRITRKRNGDGRVLFGRSAYPSKVLPNVFDRDVIKLKVIRHKKKKGEKKNSTNHGNLPSHPRVIKGLIKFFGHGEGNTPPPAY